jgi:hypothetical protein
VKVTSDPAAWIHKEYYPPGFNWADPSKIWINEVFKLFNHWRQQKLSELAPIIWNTFCDILTDIERAIPRIQNQRPMYTNQDPCPRGASSELEVFGPAMAGISKHDLKPPYSLSPLPSPVLSQRMSSAPGPMTSEEVFPDKPMSCQSFVFCFNI